MHRGPEDRKRRRENAEVLKLEASKRTPEEQLKRLDDRNAKAVKERAALEKQIAAKKE